MNPQPEQPEQPEQLIDKPPRRFGDPSVQTILAGLALTECLLKPGDICPYTLLSERLGKDPQREVYPAIVSARRRFEREHDQCVLDALPNEGIKWLTPEEIVMKRWDRDIGHARRHARSSLKRQKTTIGGDAEKSLTPELLKRRNQNLAVAGVLAHMSKPRTRRAISEQADKSGKILGAGDVLKHFTKPDKDPDKDPDES